MQKKLDEVKDTPEFKRLRTEVTKLEHNNQESLRLRNRRDAKWNGAISIFLIVILVASVVTGAWLSVVTSLSTLTWIAVLWLKERYINELKYIIDMLTGISKLESAEMERLEVEHNNKKEKSSASTNAKPNRKK